MYLIELRYPRRIYMCVIVYHISSKSSARNVLRIELCPIFRDKYMYCTLPVHAFYSHLLHVTHVHFIRVMKMGDHFL